MKIDEKTIIAMITEQEKMLDVISNRLSELYKLLPGYKRNMASKSSDIREIIDAKRSEIMDKAQGARISAEQKVQEAKSLVRQYGTAGHTGMNRPMPLIAPPSLYKDSKNDK